MKALITGASGFIGSALHKALVEQGYEVAGLSRQQTDPGQPYWHIEDSTLSLGAFAKPDIVINLAGENISAGRWTQAKKQRMIDSRVKGTSLLVEHFIRSNHQPTLFISGSAIGYYGNRGSTMLDEQSDPGDDYVSKLCSAWEAAAQPIADSGTRLVTLRTGVVLGTAAGALRQMLTPFKLGLGGVIGDGQQYFSWISIDDMLSALLFIITQPNISGPVNMVAPNPVTNYQLTKILGRVLHRPTILPLPAFAARLAFGEMANELLLSSTRVTPTTLQSHGYQFSHAHLEPALQQLLHDKGSSGTP